MSGYLHFHPLLWRSLGVLILNLPPSNIRLPTPYSHLEKARRDFAKQSLENKLPLSRTYQMIEQESA
jgi:hypothetical protein